MKDESIAKAILIVDDVIPLKNKSTLTFDQFDDELCAKTDEKICKNALKA